MKTTINDTYNVMNYGATGNGTTDDSSSIQSAINAAESNGGGTVWFPPGSYLIESTLQLKGIVKLKGTGWNGYNPDDSGSYIFFKNGFNGIAVQIIGRASEIESLGFYCEQPIPNESGEWAPYEYENNFAIVVSADDVKISDVLLFNVTQGINIESQDSVGRITLDRIHGRPLKTGIRINRALDIIRVNDVHFWSFWYGNNDNVNNYVLSHGVGLLSLRNDNPQYSNLFCLGYSVGMKFSRNNVGNNHGSTSKFKIVNADFDFCKQGLVIDGNDTTGAICNFSCQGTNDVSFQGIQVFEASNVRLQGSNINIFNFSRNGLFLNGTNSIISLENVSISRVGTSNSIYPAIEVFPDVQVNFGSSLFISDLPEGVVRFKIHGNGKIMRPQLNEQQSE